MTTPVDPRANALISSWRDNANRWTEAVRSGGIASRRLVTDKAIVQAALRQSPTRALELGCGEGWLARALASHVRQVVGVDASPELVAHAEALGGGTFHCASYATIAREPRRLGFDFDLIAANFSLLDADLQPLLAGLRTIAASRGVLVIQTLHPSSVAQPHQCGWREESFAGVDATSKWSPMPWYFRTFGDWINQVANSWRIARVEEPLNPETQLPASLLITAVAD